MSIDAADLDQCPLCHGEDGHHNMRCPNIGKAQTAQGDELKPSLNVTPETVVSGHGAFLSDSDERNPAEGNNEIPPAKPFSELRDKMSPERQAAVTEEAGRLASEIEEGDGVKLKCALHPGSLETIEIEIDGDFDEQKTPPDAVDVVSSDFLWLVAKVCHEVNRVYCRSIAHHSQQEWDAAPDWQRESAFNGVTMHFENPDATPEDSHQSWADEKVADGWGYGPVKDEVNRLHPCLVPYNQLPPAQQYKDVLFTIICKTFFGGDV